MTLPNRIVMAPMTRGFAANGLAGELQEQYYTRRAEGGVGLILTEGTVVDRPSSRNEPGIPFFMVHHSRAGGVLLTQFTVPVRRVVRKSGM